MEESENGPMKRVDFSSFFFGISRSDLLIKFVDHILLSCEGRTLT